MNYKEININTYQRKAHFEYFNGLAYPYTGVTVPVKITDLLGIVKEKGLPFFLTICYCVSSAANRVPEFRQRIKEGKIYEFDHCRTSHTVALKDGTYCYCTLDGNQPFSDYLPYAVLTQEEAKQMNRVTDEELDKMELIFISTLPWLSYTALIQPVPMPADSNPRITWGRYDRQQDETILPVSVLCHHGLVDGLHMAEFYGYLDEEIKNLANCLKSGTD